eukprot:scaffold168468_cov31-Tisochrysis_lutea.AAC.4
MSSGQTSPDAESLAWSVRNGFLSRSGVASRAISAGFKSGGQPRGSRARPSLYTSRSSLFRPE